MVYCDQPPGGDQETHLAIAEVLLDTHTFPPKCPQRLKAKTKQASKRTDSWPDKKQDQKPKQHQYNPITVATRLD